MDVALDIRITGLVLVLWTASTGNYGLVFPLLQFYVLVTGANCLRSK